uniref:Putative secreted protein n=1 Tax=Anopheles darlingi TaxID=43151 RepID=A0A2M4D2D9_ANODA
MIFQAEGFQNFFDHMLLLTLFHLLAQLEASGHVHRLLHREIGVQLIVLHDVRGQLTELAQVTLLTVHRNRTIDACCLVSRQNVEQRTLAGTGWSHNRGQLSGTQLPADLLQDGLHIVATSFLDPVGKIVEGQIDGWPGRQMGQRLRLRRDDLHPDGAIFPVIIIEQIVSDAATAARGHHIDRFRHAFATLSGSVRFVRFSLFTRFHARDYANPAQA